MTSFFLSSCPRAFWSMFKIKWLTYLRILQEKCQLLKFWCLFEIISVLYAIFKVNYRYTKAQKSKLKRSDKSKQKAFWDTAPVCKNFRSPTAFVLMLKSYCIYSTTPSFGFQMVPILLIKPCLFNLATVCIRVTGRTWLVTHEFFHFVFFSCSLPIMQEPLGEQELLFNQSLMWELQSPRQQNCFSLILHVFELRNQSPWTWLRGEPCCLLASDEKPDQGGIKRQRCAPLAFTQIGLSNHHVALYDACMHKRLLQIWIHASLQYV